MRVFLKLRLNSRVIALAAIAVCCAAYAAAQDPQPPQAPAPASGAQVRPRMAPAPGETMPTLTRDQSARPSVAAGQARTLRSGRQSRELQGSMPVRDGQRLRVVTDTGNVLVRTDASDQVIYHVRLETDTPGKAGARLLEEYTLHESQVPGGVFLKGTAPRRALPGRLWLTYEIRVPRNFNIDVNTDAGSIQVGDTAGRVNLETDGGNIAVGRVGGGVRQPGVLAARLITKGGHITVRDVTGDLRAETAGGHITAGNIAGDAVLITGGGHIHAGNILGVATLDTGGGNISVERAGSRVTASSAGGQINFGEAAGAIRAHTEGGGIRVLRVAGPMQLESNGGSIFLTHVENEVRASTDAGTITAWLSPLHKLMGASQLESGHGDIVVYVPRDMPVTIEATIDAGNDHRIVADPSLPLKINYITTESGRQMHGQCEINGGGEVLRLRTVSGNIQLRYADM
ncbi:MAG: DUF4097 family beta strand repeat-containing protein, partial [Bryobacteraceae bacterium]